MLIISDLNTNLSVIFTARNMSIKHLYSGQQSSETSSGATKRIQRVRL